MKNIIRRGDATGVALFKLLLLPLSAAADPVSATTATTMATPYLPLIEAVYPCVGSVPAGPPIRGGEIKREHNSDPQIFLSTL